MLQTIITGLAGVVLGIVVMRVWQNREGGNAPVSTASSAPTEPPTDTAPPATSRNLLIGAGVLGVAAIAVFALRGPAQTDPLPSGLGSGPGTSASDQALADVDTMIGKLAARLEKNPNDGEGHRMLGWSYLMTGHPDKAIAPYKRALALLPKQGNVHAGYGEALTGAAGGKVTDEAKSAFDTALALDPSEPRARYFLALWQAQHGQAREALEKWIALANSGPADAPWQADVRKQISETATRLGVDVSGKLKAAPAAPMAPVAAAGGALPPPDPAAVQAASQLPPSDRQAMINGMVDGLAAKLKADPKNPEGWVRLLRSRMVLQQGEQAGRDLATARKALSGDAAGLSQVNATAAELKVPGT